jgi:hypothetical protein
MFNIMEQLSTGLNFLGTFVAEAARSVRGRITNYGRTQPANTRLVRKYFESRSAVGISPARRDIVESESAPYKKLRSSKRVHDALRSLRARLKIHES